MNYVRQISQINVKILIAYLFRIERIINISKLVVYKVSFEVHLIFSVREILYMPI